MTRIFTTVLSMSLSGAVLIAVLLFGVRLLKGRLGRQWQYYIWLIVVMRLLLPFGPEASLMGQVYWRADRMAVHMTQRMQGAWPGGQDGTKNSAQNAGRNAEESIEWSPGQDTVQSYGQGTAREGLEAFGEKEQESVTENGKTIADGLQRAATKVDHGDVCLNGVLILSEAAAFVGKYLWVVWLAVALGMLIRKVSMYQSYIKYVKAGAQPVCDPALLDQLAATADGLGAGRPVELCVNPLVSSPMLVGYMHPYIILPDVEVPEKDFPYIVMHELTHYKRRDVLYKWLVQFVVCLHWFNPFVHIMSREIDRACEFACDEAVVVKAGYAHAADYGETLLNAMAAGGRYREPLAVVTMSANKELLRERLGAIMNCKRKTKAMGILTAGLTVGIVLGAVLIGVYPTAAAESDKDRVSGVAAGDVSSLQKRAGDVTKAATEQGTKAQENPEDVSGEAWSEAETYYKDRSLPLFYIAFGELDEKAQEMWLDRIYADRNHQFFSVCVWRLDADSPLIQTFAQRFYEDDEVAFFSILADEIMSEETLEGWLDQALSDQKWNFQSMLYDKLNREADKDEMEKALEEERREAYRFVGVTWNGKNCYYNEQLVHIFLDIHMPNQSFYTLDINPAGTVDIRIIREADGQITGVAYMTEAEVKELFGDMYEDEEAAETGIGVTAADEQENGVFPREMVVNMPVCRIRAGAGEEFQVVGMIGEGERVTVLEKKEGTGGEMWYLLDQKSLTEKPDPAVEMCFIRADLLT